ncbi:hypothetical protein EVAR_35923_1 [Eumeta japonica]|uniref:Uncharacterized protein n=1 Tax=Eumeta variegata TaxID=151549 RepID=A0A4C1W2A7_EUMVA|nr:hypothetical protein EVAR_35923_1 [Eumeta japonica]
MSIPEVVIILVTSTVSALRRALGQRGGLTTSSYKLSRTLPRASVGGRRAAGGRGRIEILPVTVTGNGSRLAHAAARGVLGEPHRVGADVRSAPAGAPHFGPRRGVVCRLTSRCS